MNLWKNRKFIALGFWFFLVFSFFSYKFINNLSFLEIIQSVIEISNNFVFVLIIFFILYTLRPLIFFPTSWLTVALAVVFGVFPAFIFAMILEVWTATIPYFIGRFFGNGGNATTKGKKKREPAWKTRIKENSFVGILIARLIYIPFDPVNYSSGFLKIKFRDYVLATAIGIMPSVLTFTYLGSSIENIDNFDIKNIQINQDSLIISGALFVFGIILAKLIHKKEQKREKLNTI